MSEVDVRGPLLLSIARASIGSELGLAPHPTDDAPWLREPGATFVTLRLDAELRGCIGSIDARRPLREDVAANARAAAFSDPRFEPLSSREFESVSVEVSVLSPRTPLEVASESAAAAQPRPLVDGIHPHDMGSLLDGEGIVVRAGHHCAQPVMARLGVPATTRASFAYFNTREEVDSLVSAVVKAMELFR